ncbi:MAG: 50S ribosomal protein L11 methyltransferase [Bacteroidales bacterium]|jgi:ribosomal protein L11 methyltransferase|nr:50S ribosomal protein L11 methyltransferase [Bacteroidales bacterium]MBQ2172729.1 50S ribosomal protein L11 methyltransferase [Bacteroidales bacterium]
MNSEEYIEVSVKLDPFTEEMAEILTAELSDLPFDSFVTEEPFLKCYIQKDAYRPSEVKVVLSGYPAASGFTAVLVQGQNWNKVWESEFQPIVVDGVVTVKAKFNTNVPRTRFNIWIDPRMAFGTGYHHTTFMMMQRMLGLEEFIRGRSVVDMGCGTAILAILAAKMRARKVFAVDIDAVAARSAWGNCRWNRVGTRVETACGDASLLQMGTYDVLLANIHRNIILQDLPTYCRSLRRGGHMLLSGFYTKDVPAIRSAAEALGLEYVGESAREDWACVEFRK